VNDKREAERALVQAHGTWKMLPLHPQPQWLESWSSYLIRLAEANGLKAINELAILAGLRGRWKGVRAFPDFYFAVSSERLAGITGCTPSILRATTFYPLVRHFACPLLRASRFLQGSLASSLRYCPGCLAEQPIPYYRLSWRFLALSGCHTHGCRLLNACKHCGTPIPCLPSVPQLAHCSACRGDLRTCPTEPLPQQERDQLSTRTKDLEMLLMPAEWAPEITAALVMRGCFTLLRHNKQLTTQEAAFVLNRDEQIILEMEQGRWDKHATFCDYWQYTDLLGCSLSELVRVAQLARDLGRRKPNRLDERAWLV
jgi:hypothetical protein